MPKSLACGGTQVGHMRRERPITALVPRPVPSLDARMFTTFRGSQTGAWRITALRPVKGDALPPVTAISITSGAAIALPLLPSQTSWRVAGVAGAPAAMQGGHEDDDDEKPTGRLG